MKLVTFKIDLTIVDIPFPVILSISGMLYESYFEG